MRLLSEAAWAMGQVFGPAQMKPSGFSWPGPGSDLSRAKSRPGEVLQVAALHPIEMP